MREIRVFRRCNGSQGNATPRRPFEVAARRNACGSYRAAVMPRPYLGRAYATTASDRFVPAKALPPAAGEVFCDFRNNGAHPPRAAPWSQGGLVFVGATAHRDRPIVTTSGKTRLARKEVLRRWPRMPSPNRKPLHAGITASSGAAVTAAGQSFRAEWALAVEPDRHFGSAAACRLAHAHGYVDT
jgi:hypothetical protein